MSFTEEWREDGSTRSERVIVIDWIHHQVAILGFNQPSKHHTHAQARRCMHTHMDGINGTRENHSYLTAMFGSEGVTADDAGLQKLPLLQTKILCK